MEKINLKKSKTIICPRCKGNGYFTVKESVEHPLDKVVQCPMCKSQGELDDPNAFERTSHPNTCLGLVGLQLLAWNLPAWRRRMPRWRTLSQRGPRFEEPSGRPGGAGRIH